MVSVVILILDGLNSKADSFVLVFYLLLLQISLTVFFHPDLFRVGVCEIILELLFQLAVFREVVFLCLLHFDLVRNLICHSFVLLITHFQY
jgi:hypothetical protein